MGLDKIFFVYMALAGILTGAILAAAPQAGDLWLKPYFWVLIAVVLFDGVTYLRGRNAPGTMLGMDARLLGFVIAIVLMVGVTTITGSPARFF